MPAFHVHDTYGNNYSIGSNGTGVVSFPIRNLIRVERIGFTEFTHAIGAGTAREYSFAIDATKTTNNGEYGNTVYVPVGIVGYNYDSDGYIIIRKMRVEDNYIKVSAHNATSASRNLNGIVFEVMYVASSCAWI